MQAGQSTHVGTRRRVSVDQVMDTAGFVGLPLVVMLCAVAVLILEGFDIQIIGFVAPALTTEFGITRSELAPVLGASLVGMAVGALAVGPVGDRWGRRPALLASTALFGVATLLGATSESVDALAGWRFITGIGLGGALPNATALLAEFAPPRWRNQAIAAAIVGVPIGGMFGSLIAAELIVFSGWRALFVVGGVLPLAAAAVMFLTMPESPRYLAVRGRQTARLASMLNRLAPGSQFTADDRFVLDAVPVRSTGSLSVIFSLAYLRDTLGSWVAFATNIFAVYSFFSWSPVVLTSLGLDLSSAVRGSFYFNLAGISGALVNAWLIARFGSRLPLIGMCLFGVTALSALAWLTQNAFTDPGATIIDDTALMLGVAGAGLAINAVQIGMYAVVANVYPTACRSSGVGWALGVGRIGGIVSAFAGSMLLTQAGGAGFFGGIAVALSLTFVAVALIRRHIPPSG